MGEVRPKISISHYNIVIKLSGLTPVHRIAFDDALSVLIKRHAMKHSRKKGVLASRIS